MLHQYAYAVREVFSWNGERLGPGHVLTDDDCYTIELPENAELLRRCTRITRDVVADTIPVVAAPVVDAPAPAVAPAPAPVITPVVVSKSDSASAAAPVKE